MAMASGWRGILGFDYGIVQAPLGPDISGPELVAAVANAGAIGLLRLPDWPAPDHVRELIRKTRSLTSKPFGAAIVLAFPHEENLRVVLEEKLAVLQVYWGDFPKERVQQAHRAGVKVLHQVGNLEEAAKAKEASVDGIIVQGREAGGHVIGQEGLFPLLPRVVDLVSDSGIPVIAAGGIVDGRGYVAALALGAQGVCLGTRFVATEESFAHPIYKQKLIEMSRTDYTNIFGRARWPDAPQRVLETPFYAEWKNNFPDQETEENQPIIGHSIIHGVHKDIHRFAGTVPNATATGDINIMAMYAGQGVGLITEIVPAAEVVKSLVAEAKEVIREKLSEKSYSIVGLPRNSLQNGQGRAAACRRAAWAVSVAAQLAVVAWGATAPTAQPTAPRHQLWSSPSPTIRLAAASNHRAASYPQQTCSAAREPAAVSSEPLRWPFVVAIVLPFPYEENLRVVLEEKLAVLQVYWGEFPREWVQEAHRAGVKVLHQIGSLEEAAKAKEACVDGIIVQGREAGGHVIGQEGLIPLLPKVVDLVSDSGIPVIAAGGIVDGRGYVAALALGAQGVCLGTRFLATEESYAHPIYKEKVIEMSRTDYTNVFGRARWSYAPHRVLETTFYSRCKNLPEQETEENQPIIGHSIIHGVHKDIHRFAGIAPNPTATGDISSMVMYAGQGVGLITEIIPAGEVVRRLVAEAKNVIRERFSDFQ